MSEVLQFELDGARSLMTAFEGALRLQSGFAPPHAACGVVNP